MIDPPIDDNPENHISLDKIPEYIDTLRARISALESDRDGWRREAMAARVVLEEVKKQRTYEAANKLIPGGAVSDAMEQACVKYVQARAAASGGVEGGAGGVAVLDWFVQHE